jgi:hypothetical protein
MTSAPAADAEIQALCETARRLGDWMHVALCQRALDVLSLEPPSAPDAYRVAVAHARTWTVADARAECLRIITAHPDEP